MGLRTLSLAILLTATLVLGGSAWPGGEGQASPKGPCHTKCYQAKSRAYQRCRAIPPTDRDSRNSCFKQADGALDRCLATCR